MGSVSIFISISIYFSLNLHLNFDGFYCDRTTNSENQREAAKSIPNNNNNNKMISKLNKTKQKIENKKIEKTKQKRQKKKKRKKKQIETRSKCKRGIMKSSGAQICCSV